jgi:peptidoglycan hydrolase-like protein with peptidoglycan-binding domain
MRCVHEVPAFCGALGFSHPEPAVSALSRRSSKDSQIAPAAAAQETAPAQQQGPFENSVLNDALSEAFDEDLGALDVEQGADTENEQLKADATTQGSTMAFSSDVGEDETDGEAMEVVAHEVAHALAGGGSGEEAVDQPGDAGEAKADTAGERFRKWAESGFEGEAPSLEAAAGGEAEIHRHPTGEGAVLTGNPLLMWGSKGALVKELQRLLVKKGHGIDVDGDFGPATHRAVVRFQANAGLSADGIVGPNTARALTGGGQGGQQAPEPSQGNQGGGGVAVDGDPMLRRGSSGAHVKALQQLLNGKGAGIGVDGEFGGQTESAVISFQLANGLAPDGIVGPGTAKKLNDPTSRKIGSGGGQGNGNGNNGGGGETADPKSIDEWRGKVLSAAEKHLGKRYYWGADGPNMFDCSGFVLYVLRQETGLVDWGDDTAAGIKGRLPGANSPKKGDLVFYTGSSGVSHVEMYTGTGTTEIGASGGGSSTFGNDPNAKVQYGNMTADSRSRSYGSIQGLIERKLSGGRR